MLCTDDFCLNADLSDFQFAWPSTGFFLRTHAHTVVIKMVIGDAKRPRLSRFALFIDGEYSKDIQMSRAQNRIVLEFKLEQIRVIELFKCTEAQYGTEILKEICCGNTVYTQVELRALHVQTKLDTQRKFVVLGDSITAGYGVLDTNPENSGRSQSQDARLAWASQSVFSLGMRPVLFAFSGKGLVQNYEINDPNVLPRIYKLTAPESGGPRSSWPGEVDGVSIHLGTNDYAHFPPDSDFFFKSMLRLIENLRFEWGRCPIFLMMGPIMQEKQVDARNGVHYNARELLKQCLLNVCEQFAEGSVCFFEFSQDTGERGKGAMYHPSLATQTLMGKEASAFLSQRMPLEKNESSLS